MLNEETSGTFPYWTEASGKLQLNGKWVFETNTDIPGMKTSFDLATFSEVCTVLADLEPFNAGREDEGDIHGASLCPFFHVSMYDKSNTAPPLAFSEEQIKRAMRPRNGIIALKGDRDYVLRAHRFYPNPGRLPKDFHREMRIRFFNILAPGAELAPHIIKSEYDVKDLEFTPAPGALSRHGSIAIEMVSPGKVHSSTFGDIGIPVKVAPSYFRTVVNVVVIGAGVSVPSIIAATYRPEFGFFQGLLMVVSGLVVGAVAVFGLRRSI